MSLPQRLTVKYEDRSIQFTIDRAEVFMAGEFAGNVNLYLDCDPALEPIVQECLHLQVPGEDTSLELLASGGPDDGVMLIFGCDAIALLERAPESLDFLWCGEPLATVIPVLAESAPLDSVHTLIDPLEILERHPMPTENPFRLGVERDWILFVPAFLFVGFGVGLGTMATNMTYGRLAGGVLLILGGAIAFFTWLPKRQIWFDRNRKEILLLEGRAFSSKKALQSARRCSPDGFAHVRLCEREYAIESGDGTSSTRTDYLVSLEGEIPFASEDGRVHSRSDSLHLATFSGERAAKRCAAEVGYHTGLRILIASDW